MLKSLLVTIRARESLTLADDLFSRTDITGSI